MSFVCGPQDLDLPIAERLAGYLDCRAQALGHAGFEGLSQGWLGPALLGGCLTIYFALIGYRLLLGRPFGSREAVLAALRVGAVIAFATSWPAYQGVAYRVVISGPAEVVARMLSGTDLPVLSLPDAAQRLDQDLVQLAPGAHDKDATTTAQPAAGPAGQTSAFSGQTAAFPGQPAAPPGNQPGAPASQGLALIPGAGAVLISTLGGLAAVRLAGGLLLAAGPLFVISALFDATLGLFEGWARALIAAFVGSVGTMIVASLEIGFLDAQAARAADTPLLASDLSISAYVFAAGMLSALAVAVIVGQGFSLSARRRKAVSSLDRFASEPARAAAPPAAATRAPPQLEPRAQGVADAVARLGRRDQALGLAAASALERQGRAAGAPAQAHAEAASALAASGGYKRRSARPRTASAERRDRTS
jgi:type IV secretion system protein VirB6